MIKVVDIKQGDKISYFWLPHPKKPWKDQQWNDGEVLDRNGKRIKISARVHWGKYHQFWVEVNKITFPFGEEYT